MACCDSAECLHAPSPSRGTARLTIDAAVTAMGGAERIRAIRNLTLIGYAQYAYQNGGGNISPLPGATQKYIAANDYRRIYDLDHGRMLHQERRNDLFRLPRTAAMISHDTRYGANTGEWTTAKFVEAVYKTLEPQTPPVPARKGSAKR